MPVIRRRDAMQRISSVMSVLPPLVILAAVLVFAVGPLIWIVTGALKPASEIISGSTTLLPRSPEVESFRRLAATPFLRQCGNSLVVAVATAILVTAAACSAGYVLGRVRSRWSNVLGVMVLASYMVAPIMLVIPVFVLFRRLGLANTLFGLVLAHGAFCLPFALWSLRAFFASLPREIEERAAADGLGPIAALVRAVLPMAYPGLVSTGIFSFVLSWNEYVFARVLISSSSIKTVPVGIEDLFYGGHVDWGVIMAAGTCLLVPAAVLVLAMRRQLESGWLASWQ